MKALILAAGYATRLYPLTKEYPKALLEVRGRPILDYIVEKIDGIEDIDEIIVVTNRKFILHFKKWLSRKKAHHKRVTLVDDLTKDNTTRRGAVGDISFVIKKRKIKDNLLVIGGDNLFDSGLKEFLCFSSYRARHPVIGAYDIRNIKEARKYGLIKLDKNQKVVDFQEKPKRPNSTLVAMCLYYFPASRLGLIKEYLSESRGTNKSDATGLYIDWLRKRLAVYGFVFGGLWYDIGDHKFYSKARQRFV